MADGKRKAPRRCRECARFEPAAPGAGSGACGLSPALFGGLILLPGRRPACQWGRRGL